MAGMIAKRFEELKKCHKGIENHLFHITGFTLIGIGLGMKSIVFLLVGVFVQELGHVYQYMKTKNPEESPLRCLKSQLAFGLPLLILAVLYVLS